MFIALNVVLTSFLNTLIPKPAASGPTVMGFFADPRNLTLLIPIGIFGGGFVEELQRIFEWPRTHSATCLR